MAAVSMDALGAFSHLKTSLPSWITRVSELAAHTSTKHAEYTEAFRQHATRKPRRRRNSSVCSIHTDGLVPIAQTEDPAPDLVEDKPTEFKPRDLTVPAQIAGRKRGTDEAPSLYSSDRYTLVSTRHNVIIDYDGHTQKVLEEVVRDIGVARNHIRRGKMSTMSHVGLRANLLGKTALGGSQLGQSDVLSYVRSTRTASGIVGVTGTAGPRKESPYDFADKQLELAHGLCETAAYQVLRSGDCGTELDGVEEKFKMLLEMVTNEVTRLEAEKKQQVEEQKEEEKEEKEGKEEETQPEAPPVKPPLTPTAQRLARLAALTASVKPPTTTTGTIEVDDTSSISAESIDLSAFRSSRIRV
ncbi:hypothetical protein N7462_004819 [Penicillium macrosclerotiorum]|uniref:uncharacterized protein n=1 Tax=Penicillium macrosclerotiorum TaxID=303699 RepID=UPI002549A1B3|nr:uncharacterized protein N7462_004819 [Penicillium macrosclerotiorum]KAJ5690427.1 hypothetical protein N7462_004819 [Penicillium macrosclerotiorum]